MKPTLDIRNPYRRTDGHVGARAVLSIKNADGWHQRYDFDTHGLSPDEVVDKATTIETYHTAKAARLTGFRSIQGAEVIAHGSRYRIVDCTIFDCGVTLYLDARRIAKDGSFEQVEGFPLRRPYYAIDAVPSDAEIVAMIRGIITSLVDVAAANADFSAKVKAKRGT